MVSEGQCQQRHKPEPLIQIAQQVPLKACSGLLTARALSRHATLPVLIYAC